MENIRALDSFKPACWRYITVKDLRDHATEHEKQNCNLMQLPLNTIVAKLTYSQRACHYVHGMEGYTPMEQQWSDNSSESDHSDYDEEAMYQNLGAAIPSAMQDDGDVEVQGVFDPALQIKDGEAAEGSTPLGEENAVPVDPPRWPAVEQPPGTGVLPGEVMIPAGMEVEDFGLTEEEERMLFYEAMGFQSAIDNMNYYPITEL